MTDIEHSLFINIANCIDDDDDDPIYPTPPLGQDMTQGQFFWRSLAGLNSEFSFS